MISDNYKKKYEQVLKEYTLTEAEAYRLAYEVLTSGDRPYPYSRRGELKRQAEIYLKGLKRQIPLEWMRFRYVLDQWRQEDDPEFQEYLRLREKFERSPSPSPSPSPGIS